MLLHQLKQVALRIACRARGPTLINGVVTHHFRQYSQAAVAHMITLSRLAEIQHHIAHIYYSQVRSVNACSVPCSSSNICELQRTTCYS